MSDPSNFSDGSKPAEDLPSSAPSDPSDIVESAVAIYSAGFTPIPLKAGAKVPALPGWHLTGWASLEEVREAFTGFAASGHTNIGVKLGNSSTGAATASTGSVADRSSLKLVDIDLDHPTAVRLARMFLPATPVISGRGGEPLHWWYVVNDPPRDGDSMRFTFLGRSLVEVRASSNWQTVLPPSRHPGGQLYEWHAGSGSGGDLHNDIMNPVNFPNSLSPSVSPSHPFQLLLPTHSLLSIQLQAASLALVTALVQGFPSRGSRHETYLAIAGAFLKNPGSASGVSGIWRDEISSFIFAIAVAIGDEEMTTRVGEAVPSTIRKLEQPERNFPVAGWGVLTELFGPEAGASIRKLYDSVTDLLVQIKASPSSPSPNPSPNSLPSGPGAATNGDNSLAPLAPPSHSTHSKNSADPPSGRAEFSESAESVESAEAKNSPRAPLIPGDSKNSNSPTATWKAVDLSGYLSGEILEPTPSLCTRSDGCHLMYPGRVNMLYGSSESAKSWIALYIGLQLIQIDSTARVMYVDTEDEPANTVSRLRLIGATDAQIRENFVYVHPETPNAKMQKGRNSAVTETGNINASQFQFELDATAPTLIIIDGMTALYGLHGLNPNDASETDIVTTWLKGLTAHGVRTVLVVDHTAKTSDRGSLPIGSQHKVAMVQGALLQAHCIRQPVPGSLGEIELVLLKDRPGKVRQISENAGSKAQTAAVVTLDSREEGALDISINAPHADGSVTLTASEAKARAVFKSIERKSSVDALLIAAFENSDGTLTASELAEMFPELFSAARNSEGRGSLKRLLARGLIEARGETRGRFYVLIVRDGPAFTEPPA